MVVMTNYIRSRQISEIDLKCIFWYRQQLLYRFFLYPLNHSKTLSFHCCLQFWEEEKFSRGKVRWIQSLRHDYGFTFSQKLTYKDRCLSWDVLVFPQLYTFSLNCFAQSTRNFKIVLLIDRTALIIPFQFEEGFPGIF